MKILVFGDFQGLFPQKLKNRIKKEEFDLIVGVGDYAGIRDFKPFLHDMFKRIKNNRQVISGEEFFGEKKYKALEKKDIEAGKKILNEINLIGKPAILISGNTDNDFYNYPFENNNIKIKKGISRFLRNLHNIKNITYSKTKFKGELFFGFGGYMEPVVNFEKSDFNNRERLARRKKRNERSRKNLFSRLKKVRSDFIMILHYPPYGVFDIIKEKGNASHGKSAGVKIFTEAIKKYKPKLVFCGHMHEYRGMKKLHGVPVINPGDAEEGKAAIVEIIDKKIKVRFI